MRFNWFTYHQKLTVPFMVKTLWCKHIEFRSSSVVYEHDLQSLPSHLHTSHPRKKKVIIHWGLRGFAESINKLVSLRQL